MTHRSMAAAATTGSVPGRSSTAGAGRPPLQRPGAGARSFTRGALGGLLALSAALLTLAPAQAQQRGAPRAALAPVAGEVIVQFKARAPLMQRLSLAPQASSAEVQSRLQARASDLGTRHGLRLQSGSAVGERAQLVRAEGEDAAALAARLAADPDVEWAVPNGRQRRLSAPNDPLYAAAAPGVRAFGPDSGQWYLRAQDTTFRSAVDIERAWGFTRGRSDVVVAVLDTGVRFEHPDLGRVANGGVLLPGYDFVSNTTVANDGNGRDGDPSDPGDWVSGADLAEDLQRPALERLFNGCERSDSSWHGTSTASLIAALTDNNLGMAGSAPGVRVQPVRVLGKCYGTDGDIWAAMRWAAGITVPGVPTNPNPAQVINMSLGSSGSCSAQYQEVVDEILAKGVVIVAAAGNSDGGPVGTPGNCKGVIAVLALRHAGTKVGFSDLGPEIAISAPGGNCINITPGSPCLYPILAATDTGPRGPETATWTDSFNVTVGTSFASPIVAGVAGLMLSLQPALNPTQVRSMLQVSARPFPTSGADNGADPLNVRRCDEPDRYPASLYPPGDPNFARDLQCYCTTALCGAGMLDAGAAVAAVSGPVPRIDLSTPNPTAGSSVSLSGAASSGSISSYSWELVDGGGIVSGFSSATNASTASLLPTAAGSFTVRLTVAAASGASQSATLTVAVAAAGTPPVTPPAGGGGGGGGGVSFWWVMGVLAAALALLRQPAISAARRA